MAELLWDFCAYSITMYVKMIDNNTNIEAMAEYEKQEYSSRNCDSLPDPYETW